MAITTTFFVTATTQVTSTGTVVASSQTNYLVSGLVDIMGRDGYGLQSYLSVPINTSTRVLARGINTIISDLDLVLRHITGSTVTNTVSNLSTWTDALVVNTGSQITTATVSRLITLVDSVKAQRYNCHPLSLVQHSGCDRVFDQGISTRTQPWGISSTATITMQVEAEWPQTYLASAFFNQGSEFVIQPFMPGLAQAQPVGLDQYQFQCSLDSWVTVPLSVNGVGGGRGPIYHVNWAQDPYGGIRDPESQDYFFNQAVAGQPSMLTQDPSIQGTPYQFVGLHYGDYSTKLVVGIEQGQTVLSTATTVKVSIDGGSAQYSATIPGYLDLYTGPNGGSLSAVNGWWTWDGEQDHQVSWIDIWSGRKGPDPIGLTQAITDRAQHTISIKPEAANVAVSSVSTSSAMWSTWITELRSSSALEYAYDRSDWVNPSYQTTVTTWTSATTGISIVIAATRDQASFEQSRRLRFVITATNCLVNTTMTYTTPVISSNLTCTAVTNVSGLSYEAATTEYTQGGGGGSRPWWLVPVMLFFGLF